MTVSHPLIPESLRDLLADREPEPDVSGAEWLRRLPSLIDASLARWDLVPDGEARHGECALVLPVRLQGNDFADSAPTREAILKLTWPHDEARLEHLALRHWNGRGAVRLLAADPASITLGPVAVGKVLGTTKGDKIIVFKYKNKKRYRRRTGHRQQYTSIAISEIVG